MHKREIAVRLFVRGVLWREVSIPGNDDSLLTETFLVQAENFKKMLERKSHKTKKVIFIRDKDVTSKDHISFSCENNDIFIYDGNHLVFLRC